MSVEAFVDGLSSWQVTLVLRLMALVRKAAPGATAAIKWGQPVFESDGPFAFIRPAKNHVTFGFWRGSELIDQKGVLVGAGSKMKHLKIGASDRIDDRLLSALVRQAVALNRAHGTPA